MADIHRGDVRLGNLDPTIGRERAGKRPLLIVSDDYFNAGRSGLIIVVPITRQNRNIPYHVAVDAPEGGMRVQSFIKCEDVRSIARERLETWWGSVTATTLMDVEDRLRLLMSL